MSQYILFYTYIFLIVFSLAFLYLTNFHNWVQDKKHTVISSWLHLHDLSASIKCFFLSSYGTIDCTDEYTSRRFQTVSPWRHLWRNGYDIVLISTDLKSNYGPILKPMYSMVTTWTNQWPLHTWTRQNPAHISGCSSTREWHLMGFSVQLIDNQSYMSLNVHCRCL